MTPKRGSLEAVTRRRLLVGGATAAFVGIGGCLGGGSGDGDGSGADADGTDDSAAADASSADDWAWDGTLPVESVVQHHDPSCGCCSEYVAYLERHGIDVRTEPTDDLEAVKDEFSVPADARSCHTVEFGDYLVEGHVPLEAIEPLLADEPDVDGIAAPGMPRYSPGMGPRGDDPLTIYAFETGGGIEAFREI